MGPGIRLGLILDGGVFRRLAKGVKAHRMQNLTAFQPLVTAIDIADGIIAHMAHMDFSRRIGKHL